MDIPSIGFGTFRLKGDDAYNMTLHALQNGYNHIDTAKLYGNEEQLGRAISDSNIDRTKIFITTKVWRDDMKNPNKIIKSILRSLRKLQVDYLDLVLLHAPPRDNHILISSWKTMESIVNNEIDLLKDRVRNIGVSNYDCDALKLLRLNCTIVPYVNQIELSPYLIRTRLINYCEENNIRIVAHTSLVKGEKFNDTRLTNLSNDTLISMPLLLLGWALHKKFIVIPRTSNVDHLLENKQCITTKLDDRIIKILDTFDENYATHPQYIKKLMNQ